MRPVPSDDLRLLTVTGVLLPDGTFVRQPAFATDRFSPDDPDGALLVEMLGAGGRPLLRRRVALEDACADGVRTGMRLVAATVPVPAATEAMRFTADGVVVEEFRVPDGPPDLGPPVIERVREGPWRVTWTAGHADDAARLSYVVGFSHDDGATWQPVGLPTEETTVDLDVSALPGGRRCLVAVTATDGFHTVTRRSRPFARPVSACVAMILAPEPGARVEPGQPLRLQGQGYWREEGEPELEQLEWTSSRDGLVGRGAIVEVAAPSAGEHEIVLAAGSGERVGTARTTVTVEGGEPPPAPPRRRGRRR
jgi:hypothetical protein